MNNGNPWEYTEIDFPDQLAYLTVACTTRCNFRCPYCSKQAAPIQDLDYGLLTEALNDAVKLGLKKVELTGGEALLYPRLADLLARLRSDGVKPMLVTNGTLIDGEAAMLLARHQVDVGISLSTLDGTRYDALTGRKGRLPAVHAALDHLRRAGYADAGPRRYAIHALGSRDTFSELDDLRDFARRQGCGFVLNRAIPVGGLQADNVPAPTELQRFLDREWSDPARRARVPFSGDTACNRLKAGCYLAADGAVRPCSSIDIKVGDLARDRLGRIWRKSDLLRRCRTLEQHLEGACGRCPEKARCYGCRAVAYATFGSLTAADPGCFRRLQEMR